MAFEALEVALELVASLRGPLRRIAEQDKALAEQLRRAAMSVALNLGEGRRRAGKDRVHHWRVAAGSADEVRQCLRVAQAWGYVEPAAESLGLLDRVLAMAWRLTH